MPRQKLTFDETYHNYPIQTRESVKGNVENI